MSTINIRNVCSYHFTFFIIFIFLLPIHVFAEQTENLQLKQLITKAKTINSPSRSDELSERINEAENILNNQYSTQYDFDHISEQLQDEINYADVKLDIVDDLISINYRNPYDKAVAKQMIIHLQKAPLALRDYLVKENVKVKLIDFPLTEIPEYTELRGVIPRGWEDLGKTWEDVPGAGGNPMVARIGHSNPGISHGSLNLELHEFGHIVDEFIFNSISLKEPFTSIHQEEAPIFLPDDYSMNYAEEYFAEAYDWYYYNEDTRTTLQVKAPKTFEFFNQFLSKVDRTLLLNAINQADETNFNNNDVNIADVYTTAITVFENPSANQQEVDDASEQLLNQIKRSIQETVEMNELVTIHYKGDIDEQLFDEAIENINKLPIHIRNHFISKKVRVELTNFPIIELEAMNHFHEDTLDEWENIGSLAWEDVPAYGDHPLYIQLNAETNHPFMNLELHMLSHIVKKEMINERKWNEFLTIHSTEYKYFLNEIPFNHDTNEYFSESFSYFFYSEKSKQQLKEQAPQTYKFIKQMITPKKSDNNEDPILLFEKYKRIFYLVIVSVFLIFISAFIGISKLIRNRNH